MGRLGSQGVALSAMRLRNMVYFYLAAFVGTVLGELEVFRVGNHANIVDPGLIGIIFFVASRIYLILLTCTPGIVVLAFAPLSKRSTLIAAVAVGAAVLLTYAYVARAPNEGTPGLTFLLLWAFGVPLAAFTTGGLRYRHNKRHPPPRRQPPNADGIPRAYPGPSLRNSSNDDPVA